MAISRSHHLERLDAPQDHAASEEASVESLLRWAAERWGQRVALGTSFQAGGMVLLDVAARVAPELRVLTIDTGRLPAQTYELIDRVRRRYDIEIEVLFPHFEGVQEMVRRHGPNLFLDSPQKRMLCCATRKSAPFRRALAGLDAWITGARRRQSSARAALAKVDADPVHDGVVKIAPLADWSDERVWAYVHAFDLPYNALYDQGYASIGCAPCTRPLRTGEPPRAGRWWWEADHHKECGLHLEPRGDDGSDTPPRPRQGGT